MLLSQLTFIVTDDCNYNCTYCLQEKAKTTMANTTIANAVDFFYPFFQEEKRVDINFYGGEPLLVPDRIQYAVRLLQEKNKSGTKNIAFALTTNGSLLKEKVLAFLSRHQFGLMLSFDGLAQGKSRKQGTMEPLIEVIKKIPEYPGIDFEINSVFTPKTVEDLNESLRFIIQEGGKEISFNCSSVEPWNSGDYHRLEDQLKALADFLVSFYGKTGKVPVKNFQPYIPGRSKRKGIFHCYAGKNRMAITPGGNLWGCFLFHDYFKNRKNHPQYGKYYFGPLTEFINHYQSTYPAILSNYAQLRQDYYRVERREEGKAVKKSYCFLCQYVEGCLVCPVNAAYSTGILGSVDPRICQLIRIQRKAQWNFHQQLLQPQGR